MEHGMRRWGVGDATMAVSRPVDRDGDATEPRQNPTAFFSDGQGVSFAFACFTRAETDAITGYRHYRQRWQPREEVIRRNGVWGTEYLYGVFCTVVLAPEAI